METRTFQVTGEGEAFRIHCARCHQPTWHKAVTGYKENGDDGVGGIDWVVYNNVVKCQGCDCVSFVRESTNSEEYDPEDGEYIVTTNQYPARIEHTSRITQWYLPDQVRDIYSETLNALDAGCRILAAQGLRNVIETLCTALEIQGKTLADKIDVLGEKSYVTNSGRECLHAIRELGNLATHQTRKPDRDRLLYALEVIDHILERQYVMPMVSAFRLKREKKSPSQAVDVQVVGALFVPPAEADPT